MNPRQTQLLVGAAIVLVGLLILAGLIILMRSKWGAKKKALGVVIFLLGFPFLAMVWANIAPYFFSENSVTGQVKSVDCSRDIQGSSVRNRLPDCDYQISYTLNGKEQTTKINSIANAIQLSQGQQVEVYYKTDNSNTIGVGQIGDNKSFFSYLSSHRVVFFFLFLAACFYFVGLKLMGVIGKEKAAKIEAEAEGYIKRLS
jgi:hypothetical protein